MDIPLGMVVDVNIVEWVLKLNILLYGIKQVSKNWLDLLKTGLERSGYHQYQVESCLFYRKYSVILIYVDDCVLVLQIQNTITSFIELLNNGTRNYVLIEKGDILIWLP